MTNCKYCKHEVINGIIHEQCTNEELNKASNSKEKNIPCMNPQRCGKSEEIITEFSEEA